MPAGALSPVHNYPSALFFAQQDHRVDRESVPGRDPGSNHDCLSELRYASQCRTLP